MKNSAKQIAYDYIQSKILSCEYAPNSFIKEEMVCQELGISRTPVRDALSRLEQNGLVQIYPKKGVLVSPITVSDMRELFEARIMVEPYILSVFWGDFTNQEIEALEENVACYERAIYEEFNASFAIDAQFHQMLANKCTNRYLLQMYNAMSVRDRRRMVFTGIENVKRALSEHRAIINAVKEKDNKKAGKMMEQHIERAYQDTMKKVMSKEMRLEIPL